jgi:hypothetical protein
MSMTDIVNAAINKITDEGEELESIANIVFTEEGAVPEDIERDMDRLHRSLRAIAFRWPTVRPEMVEHFRRTEEEPVIELDDSDIPF